MPMGAKITGFPEMRGKVRLLQQAMRERIAQDAVRAGAQVILERMIAAAPTGPIVTPGSTAADPGTLRSGLRRTAPRVDRLGFVSCLIGAAKRVAHLARWVEYGHRLIKGGGSHVPKRSSDTGREIGNVPAYPFLRPAYEASEQLALEAFTEKARQEMTEVLR
jgi:HK97 gp10 family phage protein